MEKSHAAGSGSQPTSAQLKEFFTQIDAGKITKERLQTFLRHPASGVTIDEARAILGERYFYGPDEWERLLDHRIYFGKVPNIPWTQEVLKNPGIHQKHFLFLGLEKLEESPLDLHWWLDFLSRRNHPKFVGNGYLEQLLQHQISKATCKTRWYLMVSGMVVRTYLNSLTTLSYDEQVRTIMAAKYEVPLTIERTTANILFCTLNNTYLDIGCYTRMRDRYVSGGRIEHVVILGSPIDGISFSFWSDNPTPFAGIAASRKID